VTAAKPRLRCSRRGFCRRLDERMPGLANEKRAGFVVLALTPVSRDPKTGAVRMIETAKTYTAGVAYYLNARDKGMMLNYCPFCGAKILWMKSNKKKPAKPRAKRSAP
jgi:hypothetical protein